MRRLARLALVCFAPFSFALQAKQYLYSEGGRWHVVAVSIDADQWPVYGKPLIFSSEGAARAHQKKIGVQPTIASSVAVGHELKSRNGSTLWTVTNQWDWNWEVKFAEWVKRELHTGWWKQHGVATDCADVLLSVRWIFARINGLPVANSTLTGDWVTYRSVKPEWETLPTAPEWYNDQKFLAGLNYMMASTYTQSLWRDSYPIEINSTALIPGSYHLQLDGANSGHTLLVNSVGTTADELPVEVLYSTVPSEVRDIWSGIFLVDYSDPSGVGFLHMRWPQWSGDVVSLVAAEQMPHYSLEEFDPNFVQSSRSWFWEEVYYRLNPNANLDKIAIKTLDQLLAGFKARVKIVEDGYVFCSAKPCVEGSLEWEKWSTPTRDGRLAGQVSIFGELLARVTDYSTIRQLLNTEIVKVPGQFPLDLRQAMDRWSYHSYSSDPNDSVAARWGYYE